MKPKCYLYNNLEIYCYPDNYPITFLSKTEINEIESNHGGNITSCFSNRSNINNILFSKYFIIRKKSKIVGYGVFTHNKLGLYLCNLCMFKDNRSNGIMRICLPFLFDKVYPDYDITLTVDKQNKYNVISEKYPNGKVTTFYQSLGFKQYNEDRRYFYFIRKKMQFS